MSKAYCNILLLSLTATTAIFIHEWVYDMPATPYTWQQTVMELVVFGVLCTGILFAAGSGVYFGICKLLKALY